jgi:hypothetical protein
MKTRNIIKGLQILQPYYDDGLEGCNNDAQEGIFIAEPTRLALTVEDYTAMIELGWWQAGVLPEEGYQVEECWACSLR